MTHTLPLQIITDEDQAVIIQLDHLIIPAHKNHIHPEAHLDDPAQVHHITADHRIPEIQEALKEGHHIIQVIANLNQVQAIILLAVALAVPHHTEVQAAAVIIAEVADLVTGLPVAQDQVPVINPLPEVLLLTEVVHHTGLPQEVQEVVGVLHTDQAADRVQVVLAIVLQGAPQVAVAVAVAVAEAVAVVVGEAGVPVEDGKIKKQNILRL